MRFHAASYFPKVFRYYFPRECLVISTVGSWFLDTECKTQKNNSCPPLPIPSPPLLPSLSSFPPLDTITSTPLPQSTLQAGAAATTQWGSNSAAFQTNETYFWFIYTPLLFHGKIKIKLGGLYFTWHQVQILDQRRERHRDS